MADEQYYKVRGSWLTTMADHIRRLTGTSEQMNLETMNVAAEGITSNESAIVTTYRANEIKCATCAKTPDPSKTGEAANGKRCTIQGSNDYIYRTFLQYDLSGVPNDATILSAKMHVNCSYLNDSAASGTTNIARVTSEWDEETCCWNLMPSWTGIYQTGDSFTPPALNAWGIWDITALVKEWVGVDKQYPNYGLHIVNNNEGSYRYDWWIRNRHNDLAYSDDGDDSNNRATYLEIKYITGVETSGVTA